MIQTKETYLAIIIVLVFSSSWVQAGTLTLPKTGQTTSWAAGDDGDIEAGVSWPISRFTDNGNGTITDKLTGLMWLKDAGCLSNRWWENAVEVVAHFNSEPGDYTCEDYSGGYSDWVLPNINELESLLNAEETSNSSWLVNQGFVDIQAQYWSSTTHANFTEQAWWFGLGGAIGYSSKIIMSLNVWPVRSTTNIPAPIWQTGQTASYTVGDDGNLRRGVAWPNPRFIDNGDGTVTDNLTDLLWLKDSNCLGVRDWLSALDAVADFNTDPADYNCEGYTGKNDDWRLPNRKELLSLIDRSQSDPALLSDHPFTGNVSKAFWSSTTHPTTFGGWYVRMSDGYFSSSSKNSSYHQVWAVRLGSPRSIGAVLLLLLQPQPPNTIFVTSVSGNGDLSTWADAGANTGLAAADAVCNARAVAAGLSGTFVAWMSDDNDDAYCRVHGLMGKMSANCGQVALPIAAGPWIRTDGFPFSATIDQLLSPTFQVYSPLRFNEFGALVPSSFVFASTTSSGSLSDSTPCTNWTSNSMVLVRGGLTENTTGQWTDGGSRSCSSNRRIICMESGVGGDLPDFTTSGKQAFVTSTTMSNGNLGGLAGADAICQGLAMTAGLTGTFKAWLSDTGTDAIDRFTSDGPWVRLDGVKIADNKADLIDGTIFTGLDLDEQNNYIINNSVWTGTTSSGVVDGSNHCNSWTDGTAGFNGSGGATSKAGSAWTFFTGAISCDSPFARLYCLED